MRARGASVVVALAAVMILATSWLGWPAPAVVGAGVAAVAAAVDRATRDWSVVARGVLAAPARTSALASVLGWGALLARAGLGGRAPALVRMLGGLAGVHGSAANAVALLLAVLTLLLGAALAWAGGALVDGLLGAGTASAPGRVSLSGTADVAPARSAERAPASQTP